MCTASPTEVGVALSATIIYPFEVGVAFSVLEISCKIVVLPLTELVSVGCVAHAILLAAATSEVDAACFICTPRVVGVFCSVSPDPCPVVSSVLPTGANLGGVVRALLVGKA